MGMLNNIKPHVTKVRVLKGSHVKTTGPKGMHERKKNQIVTVRSIDHGYSDSVGDLSREYIIIDHIMRKARFGHESLGLSSQDHLNDLMNDLELLAAALTDEERRNVIEGSKWLCLHNDRLIYARYRKPTITWAGGGGYWYWTDADNCEIV